MQFKRWLAEVGMGGGGPGSGMVAPLQAPGKDALQDYHGKEQADPKDPEGKLPPLKKKAKK